MIVRRLQKFSATIVGPGIAFTLFLNCLSGCGSGGVEKFHLSGTVTYQGRPIPHGQIRFAPDQEQGNHGPGCGAAIIDGKYSTEPSKGVVGGPYRVWIEGCDGIPFEFPGEGTIEAGKPMFAEYATNVRLPYESTTHDFDIPPQPPLE